MGERPACKDYVVNVQWLWRRNIAVQSKLVISNALVTVVGGQELCPVSEVVYSATVGGEETLGEDIQQLLQPVVS